MENKNYSLELFFSDTEELISITIKDDSKKVFFAESAYHDVDVYDKNLSLYKTQALNSYSEKDGCTNVFGSEKTIKEMLHYWFKRKALNDTKSENSTRIFLLLDGIPTNWNKFSDFFEKDKPSNVHIMVGRGIKTNND